MEETKGFTFFGKNEQEEKIAISLVFITLILFLLYFAMKNIEAWIYKISSMLTAILDALIFGIYTLFIIDYIRPRKFNLKVSVASMIALTVFVIFTIPLAS